MSDSEPEHLSSPEEEHIQQDNEYYCFLNVPRDASDADITAAYKRLARTYHPDKHQDPDKRAQAELLFTKLKNAYEVLSDPHKRAIYDCLGKEGLKEEGWAVVPRTKTPREIREEFENLARVREERRLQQRTNPNSRFECRVDATDLFDRYLYDSEYDDLIPSDLPHFEVSRLSLSSSIQAPLTNTDSASLKGSISTSNGQGNGSFTCGYKRINTESSWQEGTVTVGNGLVLDSRFYRRLANRLFINMSGSMQFSNRGLNPAFSASLENHLDRHTVGYLTYSTNLSIYEESDRYLMEEDESGMETTIIRNTENYGLVGRLQLGIPYTYAMAVFTKPFKNKKNHLRVSFKAGTFGAILEYGVEEKITEHSTLGATMEVGYPVGVTVRIKLKRSSQNYIFPFHLSDEIMMQPLFYGTFVPLMAWFTIKKLILEPREAAAKEKERLRRMEANKEKVAEAKREALASCNLMTERFRRIMREEDEKNGLVIVFAIYGLLGSEKGELKKELRDFEAKDFRNDDRFVDISLPLQCCVEDSRLILWEGSKANLPGVWDPAPGEEKFILIRYKYQKSMHQFFCAEEEAIKLPKNSHRISVSGP
eukprot:TRINITY_DN6127_c0_g1_i4.p1 TRINITY_DN6127_c0_g1~~TRINITY_DN6127_c0_g1_i4.p1  ORF type:complete len:594 (+),score=122.49 TRINITY_DN6127_c0_g1_i4:48-1829(+)